MDRLKFSLDCAQRLALLQRLLDDGVLLASEFTGGWSNNFFSAEEFCLGLSAASEQLRGGDVGVLHPLWLWFAPACDWDDFIGQEDRLQLGQKIWELVVLICKECIPTSGV